MNGIIGLRDLFQLKRIIFLFTTKAIDMKKVLAPLMGIEEDDVSIKATTNEKLGYVGREEGVCAYAVALIQRP